ncbi:MAG TPA: hypothetical protein VKU62_08095 [Thermoanaerobaculia bacterium]|nr:hypothetical protein [Thermoanaerobaculia bacterium]
MIAAGAKIRERHPPINRRVDALLERYGSDADPTLTWFDERPLSEQTRRDGRAKS